MALITDEKEVARLCQHVTLAQRRFCKENFLNTQFPEEWIRGGSSDDSAAIPPFSEKRWWDVLNDAIPPATPTPEFGFENV